MTDEEIKAKAPMFLRDMGGDPAMTCMAWGFECGPGWRSLVENMCLQLEALNQVGAYMVVADQIKSKFAELTVYRHIENKNGTEVTDFPGDDYNYFEAAVKAVIALAEELCSRTCERCGKPATELTDGWLTHVCAACYAERKNTWDEKQDNKGED